MSLVIYNIKNTVNIYVWKSTHEIHDMSLFFKLMTTKPHCSLVMCILKHLMVKNNLDTINITKTEH